MSMFARGRGSGRGSGRGQGVGGGGGGRGRGGGNKPGSGPAGTCVCPSCGHSQPHQVGIPCYSIKCPKCGATLVKG